MLLCDCVLLHVSLSQTHTHTQVWSRLASPLLPPFPERDHSAGDQDDSLSWKGFPEDTSIVYVPTYIIIHIQESVYVWPIKYTCTTDSSVLEFECSSPSPPPPPPPPSLPLSLFPYSQAVYVYLGRHHIVGTQMDFHSSAVVTATILAHSKGECDEWRVRTQSNS